MHKKMSIECHPVLYGFVTDRTNIDLFPLMLNSHMPNEFRLGGAFKRTSAAEEDT
jgi:hypothetical protein